MRIGLSHPWQSRELGHGLRSPSRHSHKPTSPAARAPDSPSLAWPSVCLAILLSVCLWLPLTDTCLNPINIRPLCDMFISFKSVKSSANENLTRSGWVALGWRRAAEAGPWSQSPGNREALRYRQGSQHLRGLARTVPCVVYSFVSQVVTESWGVKLCASIWNITACKTERPCLLYFSRMLGTKQNEGNSCTSN